MFMRMLQVKIDYNRIEEIQEFYDGKVIPALSKIEGCRFVGLIRSGKEKGEVISMTLWDSREAAESYERSVVFTELLEEARTFFVSSGEWKVQLSENMDLEYVPVQEEPEIRIMPVTAQTADSTPESHTGGSLHVRILSLKIQPQKLEEFRRVYNDEIIPALQNVPGCIYSMLSENLRDVNEALSITLWENPQAAEQYEKSGLMDELNKKVKHTFSPLFQWKMELEQRGKPGGIHTSSDATVGHYDLVSGKKINN